MKLALGACLLFACMSATAQAVYRCGDNYSQAPCPGGKVLDATDTRTAAQRAEAKRVAAQEQRNAAQLARERRELEASAKPAVASGFNARPVSTEAAPTSAKARDKKKHRSKHASERPEDFVAIAPASKGKPKKK